MNPTHHTIEEMIEMLPEPNRGICSRILADNKELFQTVQGSSHNHQAWPGGYFDHIQETMNIAILLYGSMSQLRALPFELSDALLVNFFHDIEKPWKYEIGEDGKLYYREDLRDKDAQLIFRTKKLHEYGIKLTDEQENAMRYVEGEFDDYSNEKRMMGPLAAFCHMCDVASARIWFDQPRQENDLRNNTE
jgi:hypothetical protein